LFQEPLNSKEGRGQGTKRSEGEASKIKARIPPIMSTMKGEYSLEVGKSNTLVLF